MKKSKTNHRTGSSPRLCVLSESYLPQSGGTPSQIRAMAAGLKRAGIDCFVVTRRISPKIPAEETIEEIPVHRIGPIGTGPGKKWGMLFTSFFALIRFRKAYDILYVPGFRVIGLSAVFAAGLLGKRTVFRAVSLGEMSGAFFDAGLSGKSRPVRFAFSVFSRFRSCILRKADRYVSISTPIAEELVAGGVDPERIISIPNGIDAKVFRPPDRPEKRALRASWGFGEKDFVVIYTGRLVRYKGLLTLVESWGNVVRDIPDALLVLVGEGSNDTHNCAMELKNRVAEQGLEARVRFTGNVANVADPLRAADCFVFPTEDEAFGISLIEAMACALPVVSTRIGGIKDFLVDRENGWVVPTGDGDAIARALRALHADPDLRRKIGRAARERVVARFSQDAIDKKYADLFRSLTEKRN